MRLRSEIIQRLKPAFLSRAAYLYSAGIQRAFFKRPDFDNTRLRKMAFFTGRQASQRLLIDVSHQVYTQVRGGIPRVVSETADALLRMDQQNFCFEFSMLLNGTLYSARRFSERHLGLKNGSLGVDEELRIRPGDHFLVLDCTMDKYVQFMPYFEQIHASGGSVNTVINDILVFEHPEWFPDDFVEAYRKAFPLVVRTNDRLFCVSKTTAEAVSQWIENHQPERKEKIQILTFEQGAEINKPADGQTIRPEFSNFLARCREAQLKLFILVSTIEPRKGQDFALDVFENLWAEQTPCALLFMGRIGWKAGELAARIRNCAETDRRFFFVESANDAELSAAFSAAHALFSPSLDEGYGLPLVEAALHGVPVIVSDIPIYHEVAAEGGTFFPLGNQQACADVIRSSLEWGDEKRRELAAKVPIGSWDQGAADILRPL